MHTTTEARDPTRDPAHRARAFLARRIVRAIPESRTHRTLLKKADALTLRMVEVIPACLAGRCIAAAEDEAIAIATGIRTEKPTLIGCPECAWGRVAGCWACGSRSQQDASAQGGKEGPRGVAGGSVEAALADHVVEGKLLQPLRDADVVVGNDGVVSGIEHLVSEPCGARIQTRVLLPHGAGVGGFIARPDGMLQRLQQREEKAQAESDAALVSDQRSQRRGATQQAEELQHHAELGVHARVPLQHAAGVAQVKEDVVAGSSGHWGLHSAVVAAAASAVSGLFRAAHGVEVDVPWGSLVRRCCGCGVRNVANPWSPANLGATA